MWFIKLVALNLFDKVENEKVLKSNEEGKIEMMVERTLVKEFRILEFISFILDLLNDWGHFINLDLNCFF